MLLYNNEYLYKGLLLYAFFAMLYAGYTYLVNARLPADDPKKRNYPPIRIVLAPIALPLSILLSILAFIMNALLFGLSLVAFAIALVFAAALTAARTPIRLKLPRRTRPVYQE
jgi:hypothetical protein